MRRGSLFVLSWGRVRALPGPRPRQGASPQRPEAHSPLRSLAGQRSHRLEKDPAPRQGQAVPARAGSEGVRCAGTTVLAVARLVLASESPMSRLRFSSALVLVPGVLGTGCLDLVNANVLGDATMGGETTSSTTSGETTSSTTSSTTTSSTTTSSTTSGETTSSTTTPTTGCNHDAPEPCYEGPPLTEGIGACHAGEHACLEDGSSSVQCYGQVLPSVECGLDGIDKDCNGRAVAHEWSRAVGGPDIQRIYGSAVLPDGSAVFTGYTWGSMKVGDYTLEGGAFAFKTDGAGAVTWAKSFGQLKAAGIGVGLTLIAPRGGSAGVQLRATPRGIALRGAF